MTANQWRSRTFGRLVRWSNLPPYGFRGKFSESVQCAITGPMSAHASQAFTIAYCTDSEDLPAI